MPTGFTTFTATKIQDASGTLLALGTLTLKPTDGNNLPIVAVSGGGGAVVMDAVFAITAGSIGSGKQVNDVSLTLPTWISYRATITDPQGRVLAVYKNLQPTGSTFSFDTFIPNVPAQAPFTQGPPGQPGAGFSETLTFSAAGSQVVNHGLNTFSPVILGSVTSGATYWWASAIDANNTRIFAIGPMVIFLNFLGGIATPTAPTVTLNPSATSVAAGQTVSFTAAAGGYPLPTVQWQTDTGTSGATWTDIGGATAATYTFATVIGENGYQYRAVFTNASGAATSTAALLGVTPVAAHQWPAHEGSGNTLHDAVGSADLVFNGAGSFGWIAGSSIGDSSGASVGVWPGLSFPSGSYATASMASLLAINLPFTVAFDCYVDTYSGGTLQGLVANTDEVVSPGLAIYVDSTGSIIVALIHPGVGLIQAVSAASVLPAAVYTKVAATYDGSRTAAGIKLYVNGSLVSTTNTDVAPFTSGNINSTADLWVMAMPQGSSGSGSGHYPTEGVMDNIAIYPSALTAPQVAALP